MISLLSSTEKSHFSAGLVLPFFHLPFSTPTTSNMYLANSLDSVFEELELQRLLSLRVSSLLLIFRV